MKTQMNKIIKRESMPIKLGKPPKASTKSVSRSMKANIAKNTKPELLMRKALWSAGIRGYRLNWAKVPGSPDIAFHGKKIAIFINGCFWHRCPICKPKSPKTNREFWENKFIRNVERDRLKKERLEELGWKVLIIWECQIKKDVNKQVSLVKNIITKDID